MVVSQISFAAFALAQQAVLCTPPVAAEAAAPVVAHGLGVGSGGECTRRVSALRLARYERRRAHPRFMAETYATYWPGHPDGPAVIRWSSRAHAFNAARRHGSVFVDLGASA